MPMADLRCWSNKGHVLFRGQRLPVVGRVSMDMTIVDLTGARDCGEGTGWRWPMIRWRRLPPAVFRNMSCSRCSAAGSPAPVCPQGPDFPSAQHGLLRCTYCIC